MNGGLAAHIRQGADGIPPDISTESFGQRPKNRVMLPGNLGAAGKSVQGVGLDVAFRPRPFGVAQPLRVFLAPTEAQSQKQLAVADRDAVSGQGVDRQAAQVPLVADRPPALAETPQGKRPQQGGGALADVVGHQQVLGRKIAKPGGAAGGQHRPEFDRGPQQGFDGMVAHRRCSPNRAAFIVRSVQPTPAPGNATVRASLPTTWRPRA